MDCEKFEASLLDELYDELDEVTSAAAKRHVAGCSRCASLLSGLRATRRLATLERVEPPDYLEEKILAAARAAQEGAPLKRRFSRAISWAGSWAMRPQTAMAALFLLTIGFGTLLLKGKHSPTAAVTVSDEGEPVAKVSTGTMERPPATPAEPAAKEAKAAAAAAPPPPAVMPQGTGGAYAYDAVGSRGGGGRLNLPASKSEASDEGARAVAAAAAPRALKASAPPPPAAAPAARPRDLLDLDVPASGAAGASASPYDVAMGSYNSGDYAAATSAFDQLAAAGDSNAALMAARSVREGGGGCQQAVPRFDQVARAAAGTPAGYDALFEAGHCYRLLGQVDLARQRLRPLLTVPSYIDRANGELAAMAPKGTSRGAGARAAPKAAPAPTVPVAQ